MDLIHLQIQTTMANQSQVNISQPKGQEPSSPQQVITNNQITDEMIAREAGRGIDREGGNYQC